MENEIIQDTGNNDYSAKKSTLINNLRECLLGLKNQNWIYLKKCLFLNLCYYLQFDKNYGITTPYSLLVILTGIMEP